MSFSSTSPRFRMVWRLSSSVRTLATYVGAGTGGQLGAQTDKIKIKICFQETTFSRGRPLCYCKGGCHACLFKEDCLYTIFDNSLWDIGALKRVQQSSLNIQTALQNRVRPS